MVGEMEIKIVRVIKRLMMLLLFVALLLLLLLFLLLLGICCNMNREGNFPKKRQILELGNGTKVQQYGMTRKGHCDDSNSVDQQTPIIDDCSDNFNKYDYDDSYDTTNNLLIFIIVAH